MRHHQVLILVDFIWVFGTESCFGRKWELCHTIIKLLNWCRYFFRDVLLLVLKLLGRWGFDRLRWWVHNHFGEISLPRLLLLLARRVSTIIVVFKLSRFCHVHLLLLRLGWRSLVNWLFLFVTASDLLPKLVSVSSGLDLSFADSWAIQLNCVLLMLFLGLGFSRVSCS